MNRIVENDVQEILKETLNWSSLKGKTIMVTGASGFIPSYIVETLLAIEKVKVVAVVRNKKKAEKKFAHHKNNKNLEIIVQDISKEFDYDKKLDYIIHAASQASPKYYGIDPVGTLKANTLGTAHLLDLAKRNNVEKFLFFSSGEVYGVIKDDTPEIEETYTGDVDITSVRSCYAESKRMGENMCVCYSHQFGFPVNMIRLSHTYGAGVQLDDGRVFGDFVKNILNNENIVLNSDGSAKRSFCYISDMIRALFYVLFKGENMQAYNVASKKETSILELANLLVSMYPEKALKVEFAKDVFQKGYIKSKSLRANFNVEKLEALGWMEKIDIKTGFTRMVESYK